MTPSSSPSHASSSTLPSRVTVRAPGRVNLIGEHTDYNGGLVLPCAIDQSLTISVSHHHEPFVSISTSGVTGTTTTNERTVTIPLTTLEESWLAMTREKRPFSSLPIAKHFPSWTRYAIGAWCTLRVERERQAQATECGGLIIHLKGDLPAGGGLSSSAALSTGLLSALFTLYGIDRSRYERARSAMLIEHTFIGTKCGLMDQLAILESEPEHLTKIDFSTEPPRITRIPVSNLFDSYKIVIINSGVSHSLATSAYNERRRSCETAVATLNDHFSVTFPTLGHFASPAAFAELWHTPRDTTAPSRLPLIDLFSKRNPAPIAQELTKRTRHVLGEILRVEQAIDALTRGDARTLDVEMRGSHRSLRDDYEVSCDEIEQLSREIREVAHKLSTELPLSNTRNSEEHTPSLIGPRLCGGGFGGSVVQLVHTDLIEPLCDAFSSGKSAYEKTTRIVPQILRTGISGGLTVTQELPT